MSEPLPDDVQKVLGPGEQVQLYLKQKIYHPKISIDSVVITSERVILRHPHAMNLKKDYTDYSYRDVSNVILDKGLVRSTIKVVLKAGGDSLDLGNLPNADAQKAYGLMREDLTRFQAPFPASEAAPYRGQVQPSAPQAGAPEVVEKEVVKVRCTYCGTLNDETATACSSCGAKL